MLTEGGDSNILLGLLHSVFITVGSIVGLCLFGSLAAYVLVRSTSRWSTLTFTLFLVAIILPVQLGIIPLFIMMRQLGWTGQLGAAHRRRQLPAGRIGWREIANWSELHARARP